MDNYESRSDSLGRWVSARRAAAPNHIAVEVINETDQKSTAVVLSRNGALNLGVWLIDAVAELKAEYGD